MSTNAIIENDYHWNVESARFWQSLVPGLIFCGSSRRPFALRLATYFSFDNTFLPKNRAALGLRFHRSLPRRIPPAWFPLFTFYLSTSHIPCISVFPALASQDVGRAAAIGDSCRDALGFHLRPFRFPVVGSEVKTMMPLPRPLRRSDAARIPARGSLGRESSPCGEEVES